MRITSNQIKELYDSKLFELCSIPIIDYSGKSVLVFPIDTTADTTGLLNTKITSEDNLNQKCLILDTIIDVKTKTYISTAYIGYMYFNTKEAIKYSYSENSKFYNEQENRFYKQFSAYDGYVVTNDRIISENILLTNNK